MFERFTDGSRRAVVLAQEAAVDLRHDRITVEHLLLGVARADQGAGTSALADLGVTPETLREAVRKALPPAPHVSAGSHVPFTPAAKQAMEYSLREAMKRGANSIDTGHILLALLRQGGDELPAVLTRAQLDGVALGPAVEKRLAETARDSPQRPSEETQLDRIEALLVELLARVRAVEARLDQPPAG